MTDQTFETGLLGDALPSRAAPVWARPLLRRVARLWIKGGLRVVLPNGVVWRIGEETTPCPTWEIRRWRTVGRLIRRGDIGFAEGYIAGDWDTPDLTALLLAFADNYDALAAVMSGSRLLRGLNALGHAFAGNSRRGARRNIMAHYDLGNDFYQGWLDPSMTYSSALFERPNMTLEEAQRAKYAALAREADIKAGDHVLEIGCGWGGFALYAAGELGARVTALTLSPAQKAFAVARVRERGLSNRIDVRLVDYRDIEGRFDAIVSIEMFEAVGETYWPTYFRRIRDLLKPGAKAALQIITIRDDLFDAYRRRPDFIQMHVFPGGMLPSESALGAVMAEAELSGRVTRRFGADYARTLAEWRTAFDGWNRRPGHIVDARFERLWRYYLSYCEAGFRSGRTDVVITTTTAAPT